MCDSKEETFKEENGNKSMATKRGCLRAGKKPPRARGGKCGAKIKRSTKRKVPKYKISKSYKKKRSPRRIWKLR